MASSILTKIYKNSEEVTERVVSIDKTLTKIYQIEAKESKAENKERKDKDKFRRRELQTKKREASDRKKHGIFGKQTKQEKKEEKNFLMDILKGALGGVGGLLNNAFSILTGALTGLAGPIAALLGGALSSIAGVIPAVVAALPAMLKGGAIVAAIVAAIKTTNTGSNRIYEQVGGQGTTKAGTNFTLQDVTALKEQFHKFANENGLDASVRDARIRKFEDVSQRMRTTKTLNDDLYSARQRLERLESVPYKTNRTKQLIAERKRRIKTLEENLEASKNLLTESFADLQISDRDLVQLQIDTGRRDINRLPSHLDRANFNERGLLQSLDDSWAYTDYNDMPKRQTGGFTVPGSSTGDRHPYMLPPGSFILNRNAAQHFQTGGALSPVMLESKERVLLPGDPMMPMAMMMNDAIPRFQSGGLVQANHPHTGPGWSIGSDSQGRPSVFHKTAAEALMQAINESNGLVKTSDITSSQRSVEHNARVGGVPNSNHLTGFAVDIHGTSKAWLKQNGEKYGWKNLNYSGHDGHFDFVGGDGIADRYRGNGQAQEGNETTSAPTKQDSFIDSALSTLGGIGTFASTVIGGIGGYIGQEIFGGGNLFDMFAGNPDSSGNNEYIPGHQPQHIIFHLKVHRSQGTMPVKQKICMITF